MSEARRNTTATPAPPGDLALEARIGNFVRGKWRIDGLLGTGGMAAVYAATHRNGSRAALKVLHAEFARDRPIYERFLREAYVSNRIRHPACVAVLDDDVTDDGEPFLVMELLEGETLRDLWMRTGRRMPVGRVLEIVDPILDCLAACHAIGVIHRDLKPANVFITTGGAVKLLDFGVAQMRSATAERTAAGTALGTPHYMSPEQAMGLVDQLDGRSDLFAVGAMMHALLTGQRINNGRTENEALILAATTPAASAARIAPDLPLEVIALIDRALAWDRRSRFADALEMQAAVRKARAAGGGGVVIEDEEGPPSTVPAPAPNATTVAPPRPVAKALVEATSEGVEAGRIAKLRDLFKHVDRLLQSVRQLGWPHAATDRALRATHESFAAALAQDRDAVAFDLEPYSFTHDGACVWEPLSPFDAIPYHLFSSGIRSMKLQPGVSAAELRELLTVVTLDPARDLPPEDDLAATLWERSLPHVTLGVVELLADADAASRERFYDESEALERAAAERAKASRLEARAMALSTDRDALRGARGAVTGSVDRAVRAALALQLELSREEWSERFVDVLCDALAHRPNPAPWEPLRASLRRSVADLARTGKVDVVTQLYTAARGRLACRAPTEGREALLSALTTSMFGGDALEHVLRNLEARPSLVPSLAPALEALPGDEVPILLRAVATAKPGAARAALLAAIARLLPSHEGAVAAAATTAPPDVAVELLGLLGRSPSPAAVQALSRLAREGPAAVALEARALLSGSDEALRAQLCATLDSPVAEERIAALRVMDRHDLKLTWPAVARQARSPSLHERSAEERRALFRAIVVLQPDKGEPLLLEIAKRGSVFISEPREMTRAIAAEVLGQLSRSAEVGMALSELGQSRWGVTDQTRAAAAAAAVAIFDRVEGVEDRP